MTGSAQYEFHLNCLEHSICISLGPASPISFTAEHQAQLFYAGCKSGLEGGQCICQGLLLPSVYFRVTWKQGVIGGCCL